jgi:hypothetical protein
MASNRVGKPATHDWQAPPAKRVDCGPKLRSTCDRCALLKVRCDKQKPRCERCKAVNAACVYGPYRWKGRAPASGSTPKGSTSSSRSPTPLRDNTISTTPSRVSSATWDTIVPVANAPSPASLEYTNFAASMFHDTDGVAWAGLMPNPGTEQTSLDGWYAGLMEVDPEGKGHSSTLYDHSLLEPTIPVPSPTSTLNTPLSHVESASDFFSAGSALAISTCNSTRSSLSDSSTSCRCSSLPITILQDMYQAETGCRLSLSEEGASDNSNVSSTPGENSSAAGSAGGLPRSDQIVTISRSAVQHMEQLLTCECGASTRDPTLLFLVTALTSKLLTWYHAAFTVLTRSPAADVVPSSSSGSGDALDLGFATPIQVGDFHLDFGSEQRMKAQFMLCEVRRLGRVLELFNSRAMGGASGKTPIAPVHRFLVESLGQLVTAMKDYCVS